MPGGLTRRTLTRCVRRKVLNSGERSRPELLRPARTAYFINAAGVTAQSLLPDPEAGISTRRLFKLLANTVWEWHWLSHLYKKRFRFLGCGDLLWVPHYFGALGLVHAKNYPNVARRKFNLFIDPLDLFSSRLFRTFNTRG